MYYIYHIPKYIWKNGSIGKIGTSTCPKRRVKMQGYSEYEVLEKHTDINVVSDREIELQKQYGYPVDTVPYKVSYEKRVANRSKQDCIKGGKTQGRINAINGHLDKVRDAKKGGIAASSIIRKCPHCNKVGKGPPMFRWHFDNCKKKN